MWEFLGVALAALAIIVIIVLYLLQRNRKGLSYEVVSHTPLLSRTEEVGGKLQILFDGKTVQDVHLVEVRIINSGNTPILPADYERPISLKFGENAQILTADVAETAPDSIRASISVERQKVVITPLLLNAGDSIKLKVLVAQSGGEPIPDGRIAGVRQIRKAEYSQVPSLAMMYAGTGLVVLGTLLYPRPVFGFQYPLYVPLVPGIALMVAGMARQIWRR